MTTVPGRPAGRPRPSGRRWPLLAAALLWSLAGPARSVAADSSVAQSTPPDDVVLLHGLGRRAASMELLAERLEEAGFRVHNLSYASRQADPDTLLDDLSAKIDDCCTDATRLHFVGHSLGGILARAYVARARPDRLGRVIMLSPPNQGSEIIDVLGDLWLFQAVMGPTGGALGTGPDSLPNRLPAPDYELGVIAATESINPLGSWLIPGDDDGMVSVCRMRVAGMADFMTVERTHAFVMRGPEVAAQVVAFLHTGRFERTDADRAQPLSCD
jgi:pimeloyl-ACP methyl ester carboxylesterase